MRTHEPIHFGSFDGRSCLNALKKDYDPRGFEPPRSRTTRRITTDPNAVTCRACQDNDRLELSPEAKQFVAELVVCPGCGGMKHPTTTRCADSRCRA